MTTISAAPRTRQRPTQSTVAPRGWLRPHVVRAVFSRNFLGYFSNPAGYVFITLFVLVCSWFEFWLPEFFARNLANLDALSNWMPHILLFFVPAITMNIWSEERKQGTDELLLTLPARDHEVVLGKYLAAVGIYSVSLAFLAVGHTLVLRYLGRPDLGVLASTYFGYWLMGATLIAIGMVASMLTSSVTVGFILGALFCAIPVFAGGLGPVGQMLVSLGQLPGMGWLARWLGADAGRSIGNGLVSLSIPGQFRDFAAGVISATGVFYFVGLAAIMLYVNMLLLGRRHWAGGRTSGGRWTHAVVRVCALAVALLSAGSLLTRLPHTRLDATEERLHSLSQTARDMVASIPSNKPVYISAYYSPDVPREFVEVQKSLINTLREFDAIGGDRIRLNLVETARFSSEAREAERRYGIKSRRMPVLIDGRQGTEDIYLGVVFTSGVEQVVVPFFDRGLPVEYEVTRSIRVVSGTERKRVGILETGADLLGRVDFRSMGQRPEWAVVSELKKQYNVTTVSPDQPIPFEEVQTITVSGEPSGGTFKIQYAGESTSELPHNCDAAAVQAALEALPTLEPGDLKVEGGPLPAQPIRITFTGRLLGANVPDLEVQGAFTGEKGARPTIRAGTTTEVLDALVVAQPTTLTQPQVTNLIDFVRKGGPTLLLLDPLPLVDPTLAPTQMPSMFGQPPPPRSDLRPLLDVLGITWNSSEIVWNAYNPHLQFQLPVEYVFITRSSSAVDAFADDPITSQLQEIFFPYPGHLRSLEMPGDPQFRPLLRTDAQGGVLTFNDIIARGPLGIPEMRTQLPHFPSGRAYTLAARVQGKPREAEVQAENANPVRPVHVVLIADLDMISDSFFELRRKPVESLDSLDFDNVSFFLNCVDVLAKDESFLDLRKKRPRFRTLTRLEEESKHFIEQSQREQQIAESQAKEQLEAARDRLRASVDKIRQSTEYDERTKQSMVAYQEQVENRRLSLREAEIESEKNQRFREIEANKEQAIGALRNRVRVAALLLPPIPVIALGLVVYLFRSGRENRGASPSRLS